jgi:hypothetical protein
MVGMMAPDDDLDVDPFAPDLLEPDDGVVASARGSGTARQAVLRPASVERATPDQHDALHALQRAALEARQAQATLRAEVEYARDLGVSWGVIGWCVGTSGEAARQRYGQPDPRPRSAKPRRRR